MSRAYFGTINPPRTSKDRVVFVALSVFVSSIALLFLIAARTNTSQVTVQAVVENNTAESALMNVIVPIQSIQAGTRLSANLFRTVSVPSREVSYDMIRSASEVDGLYARTAIMPETPFTRQVTSALKPMADLTNDIPAGFRAVSIRVDAQTSVEGWVDPGTRVDVVWTSKIGGKQVISVIAENAKVLSKERSAQPSAKAGVFAKPIPSTVTLLVPIDAAKRIQLASVSGSLSLSLRGYGDTKSTAGGAISTDDLVGITDDGTPKQAPVRAMVSIREHNGKSRNFTLENGSLVPANL